MTGFERYALYYAPEPGALADFGASWLGWDAGAGMSRPHPDLPALPVPVADLTATPRKYGFHGTLKPPFRLAPGSTPAALHADAAALCATLAPVTLGALRLARIGRFLALVPEGGEEGLAALAAALVRGLDAHRAPPTEAESARRRAARLSPRQEALLARWGYPYVMEEFRFHLTLTGPLDPATRDATEAALGPVLAPLLPRPFRIGSACLFGEAPDGRFHLVHRYALTG
ncbi:DUF1045 domain-containing protein [Roseivivax isoporae]|uniref:Phosphonate metabolism protein n=1 Tax=Roseivivax isoporae LMG 25204 TaxID=1449351 RepID=X7F4K4_9RHOB|nr:DUF1045 domain-containing protein [Roseivivax isoporae]ETX27745.1 phosphonate metabolism protein [Roseivivax isoporae LMG 25204]